MPKIFVALILSVVTCNGASAQLPGCSPVTPGLIYWMLNGQIYNYNPALPVSATNPVANSLPVFPNGSGLAVGNNINGAGPSPTFYVTTGLPSSQLHYWNGTSWTSTGHASQPGLGGSKNYVYHFGAFTPGGVSRYNGNTSTLVLPIGFGSYYVADVAGDCEGNFICCILLMEFILLGNTIRQVF